MCGTKDFKNESNLFNSIYINYFLKNQFVYSPKCLITCLAEQNIEHYDYFVNTISPKGLDFQFTSGNLKCTLLCVEKTTNRKVEIHYRGSILNFFNRVIYSDRIFQDFGDYIVNSYSVTIDGENLYDKSE